MTETPSLRLTPRFKAFLLALIFIGLVARLYDVRAPWKTHDHYNYGGAWMTAFTYCLKTVPLEISKGIPTWDCWKDGTNKLYPAHEPTLLFAMWGWTALWGDTEASYRTLICFFSALNILLVFKIARLSRPEPLFAWLAAVFQSGFLAGIYFGTHPDFIGEFTVFFVLLSAWFALQRRINLAAFACILAGLSSWPGYIAFGPLWIYSLAIRHGRKRVFAAAVLSAGIALATIMWLHQATDVVDFLRLKLTGPKYLSTAEKSWLEPLFFVTNFFRSQARLLSPLFCVFAFFTLMRREGADYTKGARSLWRSLSPFHYAVWLCGGTGLIYALLGHEYMMVHVFLYLLMVPGFALLAARGVEHLLSEPLSRRDLASLSFLSVLFASFYPYGIYATNKIHDVCNSILFIGSVLAFLWFIWRRPTKVPNVIWILIPVGLIANISQMINYRNEPDTERSYCEKERARYRADGKPIYLSSPLSDSATLLYCRDIPVEFIHGCAEHLPLNNIARDYHICN